MSRSRSDTSSYNAARFAYTSAGGVPKSGRDPSPRNLHYWPVGREEFAGRWRFNDATSSGNDSAVGLLAQSLLEQRRFALPKDWPSMLLDCLQYRAVFACVNRVQVDELEPERSGRRSSKMGLSCSTHADEYDAWLRRWGRPTGRGGPWDTID
eukprot:scaffold59922_cov31-Tisochrysis_lutea.AAC.3